MSEAADSPRRSGVDAGGTATGGPSPVRVFLATPRWTIYRSTDRDYVYRRFRSLAGRFPLRFSANRDPRFLAVHNARFALHRLATMIAPESWWPRPSVEERVRVPRGSDVVFSYGQFADDPSAGVPVVWEQTFAPPCRESDEAQCIAELRRERNDAVRRAAAVVTATEASVETFARAFPWARDKVRWIPYYLPDVEPIPTEQLERKQADPGPLRALFIGKQGRRKGLDTVVEAWRMLAPPLRRELEISVVSPMLDGPVALPPEFRYLPSVPDALAEMRDAHILLFPTKREAFGLVLVEAMAAGCAIVTTDALIQRSIVGEGGGLHVNPHDPHALRQALVTLLESPAMVHEMARRNRARFVSYWHHGPVGQRYADLLSTVARTGRPPSP